MHDPQLSPSSEAVLVGGLYEHFMPFVGGGFCVTTVSDMGGEWVDSIGHCC